MKGNSISITGNITRDAEVRSPGGGTNVIVSFGIAWNRSKKNRDGEYIDIPSFFDVKCWMTERQEAVLSPQLVKGAPVAIVDGHVEQERWEDDHGNKRSKIVIMVDDPFKGLVIGAKTEKNPYKQVAQAPNQTTSAPAPAPAPAPAAPAPAPGTDESDQLDVYSQLYDEDIPF